MKYISLLFIAFILVSVACSRPVTKANDAGNRAFAGRNYEAALQQYEVAKSDAPNLAELSYNTGNTHYRRREFVLAQEQYQQALLDADEDLAQDTLFNLGNTFFSNLEFERAIDAYTEALRLDLSDEDAQHNLELALRQFQRRSPASNPEDGPQEQEIEQEQQQPDPQQQNQQNSNQGSPEDQQQQEQPDNLDEQEEASFTEDQARQLLESIGQSTETLRGHLQRVFIVQGSPPANDW